jgi:polyhydroxyalkanoate synthesis regulator phasin
MSDMRSDINKFAKIWDSALEKGIFDDAPKLPPAREPGDTSDFFGQYMSDEYDMDEPLNEVDTKYWAKVARMADHSGHYVDPLSEETKPSKEDAKNVAEKIAGAHNPIRPGTIGKDQEPKVTQNWGVGGKEHFQLEELKVRLEKLESKLNSIESKGDSGKDTQGKIDSLKKQIDELSDSLSGNRWDS